MKTPMIYHWHRLYIDQHETFGTNFRYEIHLMSPNHDVTEIWLTPRYSFCHLSELITQTEIFLRAIKDLQFVDDDLMLSLMDILYYDYHAEV